MRELQGVRKEGGGLSARPWYKRYGADFITGTLELSLEEKGAYSVCLDLIYDRGAAIPDDPQWISRACGCSVRKWKIIRQKLIDKGKIFVSGECLDNFRAEKTRENDAKEARKFVENGAKGGLKTAEKRAELREINNLTGKGLQKTRQHTRSQIPERKKEKIYKKEKPLLDDFVLTHDDEQYAIRYGCDPPAVLEDLRGYCQATGKTYKCYRAAYRNFCRMEAKRRKNEANRRSGQTTRKGEISDDERRSRIVAGMGL